MIYKMTLKDSVDTMTFNLLETPIVDKDIEGAVDNVTLDGNQYTDYLYLKKQYIQKWAIMCPDEYDELRGFYTRQFEEGEVPSYRVYYGANVTRDYTLNGDYFQFNAEGIETGMTLSQLLGNAEQTTYSGKNLLPSINTTRTRNGVTFTHNDDGSISLSGTASADTAYPINVDSTGNARNVPLPAGNYIVSGGSATSPTTVYMQAYYGITGGADRYSMSTFTLGANGTMGAYIYVKSGANTNGKTIYPMVEAGSTATAYEPYVGGIPAPNPQFPMPISTVTGAQNIEVVGKNLWDNFEPSAKSASITWTPTDNGGTFTNTETWSTGLVWNYTLDTTQQYTVRLSTPSDAPLYFYVRSYTDDTYTTESTRYVHEGRGNISRTFQPDTPYVRLFFWNGQAINDGVSVQNMMLELGSTATAYEPYQGQSQEINLGKNLWGGFASSFNFNSGGLSGYTNNADGTISIPAGTTTATSYSCDIATATSNNRFITLKAGSYAVSGGTSDAVLQVITQGNVSLGTSFTITSDTKVFIRTRISSGVTMAETTIRPQIEAGSVATSYSAYFTPIELAKIGTYQDRIYKNDGKWYIEKQVGKVVFDGSGDEGWWLQSGTTNQMRAPISGTFAGAPLMSDYFHNSSSESELGAMRIYTTGYIRAVSNQTSANDFKTWLSTHNTTVYYALATPTTTEITDETLLSQLNFLASLYKGENNISLVGTGAQGEMEVFIRDVMSVETDVVPEVPVRITLTDDGAINACGCRRNVQLTMRETTE